MATLKQKLAVDKLVETRGSVSAAMRAAGYSEMTAKNPSKLTESNGFKELCESYGLTENLILQSLVEDIENKPQRRVGELSLGAEILGMKRRGDSVVAVQVNVVQDREKYA